MDTTHTNARTKSPTVTDLAEQLCIRKKLNYNSTKIKGLRHTSLTEISNVFTLRTNLVVRKEIPSSLQSKRSSNRVENSKKLSRSQTRKCSQWPKMSKASRTTVNKKVKTLKASLLHPPRPRHPLLNRAKNPPKKEKFDAPLLIKDI